MPYDDYSPIYQGDTLIPFAPVFQTRDEDGRIIPFPLQGVSIAMLMVNQATGEEKLTDDNAWVIDNANQGQAHYQWQPDDVRDVGLWTLSLVLYNGEGRQVHGARKVIEIRSAPQWKKSRKIALTEVSLA